MYDRRGLSHRVLERNDGGEVFDVRRYQPHRVGGQVPAVCYHRGDNRAHEANPVGRQDRPFGRDRSRGCQVDGKRPAGADQVRSGEDRDDAGCREGRGRVDTGQPSTRHGASQQTDMQAALRPQVVDELSLAAQQAAVLQPLQAPADRSRFRRRHVAKVSVIDAHWMAVARGDEPADLVLSGGHVLSVFTKEWLDVDVAVKDGHVVGLGRYEGRERLDVARAYLVSWFIEVLM